MVGISSKLNIGVRAKQHGVTYLGIVARWLLKTEHVQYILLF